MDDLRLCGCGDPESQVRLVATLLNLHPLYEDENQAKLRQLLPDEAVRQFVLNQLAGAGLTEHGSIIYYGWLTPKGERFRDAMALVTDYDATLDNTGYSCSDCPKEDQ